MTWNISTAERKAARSDRALRRISGRRWPYHFTCKGRRASKWRRVYSRCLDIALRHLTSRDFDAACQHIMGRPA